MRTHMMNSARAVLGVAVMVAGAACADKAFTPVKGAVNPHMRLMVMATSAQQVAPSAKYVWVAAAAIIPGGDTGLLAMKSVPTSGGTQNVTLDVDISRCLSATADKGGSGCSILVAAALRADSIAPTDTIEKDPFVRAFDYVIAGPFDVSTGRAPTIPTLDLSVSRFTVFDWAQDGALRLGEGQYVVNSSGPLGRVLAGTASGTAAPVLYTVGPAVDYSTFNPNQSNNFTAYPALGIFENGSWRRVLATTAPPVNTGASSAQGFMDVTALATNDVYLAATSGLWKFDGAAFTKITAVTDSLYSVGSAPLAGGGRVVIAGAPGGIVWIGYGTSWQRYNTGSGARFDGVCITGTSEAYAASNNSGALYRFNGTTWTSVNVVGNNSKFDLQCPAPGVAFVAVGGNGFFRWNGSAFAPLPSTGLGPARSQRMAAASATELYVAADSANTDRAFYRGDGTSFSEITRRRFAISPIRMWADPRGGAAYVLSNYGRLEKMTPASVSVLSYLPALHDVVMTSANSAFAVGTNMFLARWDGARWTIDTPPAGTQATRVLQGVWSEGPTNAWAVGNGNTILRYNGSAWSVVSDVNKPIGPVDNYNAVWGSGSDVWVAGESTLLHCKAAGSCAVEASGPTAIYSVWGSSTSNVFAVGSGGRILRYNGTSWTVQTSPTSRNLARVQGSGANDVWAFGDSVLVHFDGTQWTNYPLNDDLRGVVSRVPSQLAGVFHLGLWVKGPKEAYIGGDPGYIVRWDGAGWREMQNGGYFFGRRIIAISGASGCAIAVTEGQSDLPTQTVWRGIGSNGCLSAPMGAPPSWP